MLQVQHAAVAAASSLQMLGIIPGNTSAEIIMFVPSGHIRNDFQMLSLNMSVAVSASSAGRQHSGLHQCPADVGRGEMGLVRVRHLVTVDWWHIQESLRPAGLGCALRLGVTPLL